MNELNLEVGQKVWSIQLGDCGVYDKSAKLIYCSNGKRTQSYVKDGKKFEEDECQSLFESNPFYRSVDTNETNNGWIRIKEDGSNLPKKRMESWVLDKNGRIEMFIFGKQFNYGKDSELEYVFRHFTHYQPITKPLPPLY
jgi:hypothetical protein